MLARQKLSAPLHCVPDNHPAEVTDWGTPPCRLVRHSSNIHACNSTAGLIAAGSASAPAAQEAESLARPGAAQPDAADSNAENTAPGDYHVKCAVTDPANL